MKVIYDNEAGNYLIVMDPRENVTCVNTDDIVKAREYFIDNMTYLFNDAVCEQLKFSEEKNEG